MAMTLMTDWRRNLLLAGCMCVGLTGAASADTYAYLYINDQPDNLYNFGVADLTSGSYTVCGNTGQLLAEVGGTVYGAALGGSGFYTIDPSNGALTLVGNSNISFNAVGSTDSTVYALDSNDWLYTVDPATGAATEVGKTGMVPATYVPLSSGSSNLYALAETTLIKFNLRNGKARVKGGGYYDMTAVAYAGGKIYAGTASSPPAIYKISGHVAQKYVSTISSATGAAWGMAPTTNTACPD